MGQLSAAAALSSGAAPTGPDKATLAGPTATSAGPGARPTALVSPTAGASAPACPASLSRIRRGHPVRLPHPGGQPRGSHAEGPRTRFPGGD